VKGKALLCLNDQPYFFHGLLDQGYFSDGIYLPATEDGFKNDILKMKECGFNMLRKHIKLEPELFYYYCDKYGMAVFQDFINSGRYDFFIDTAIPTVWLRRGLTHRANEERKKQFYRHGKGIIDTLYNHPSVIYYTIFNEGWGQFKADQCYTDFKSMDETRIFDTTSGWFKETRTDVESDHIYFKPIKLAGVPGKPMVLSEFGGYSCKVKDHSFNLDENSGYHFFTEEPKELEKEVLALYRREILPTIEGGLCATVYTQVSDVEDETNGLMTYDRQVLKVEPGEMKAMAEELFEKFNETHP
ncbi:MAG: glycoside hydrolase family 2, partial [Clostridia bacterium]|nr:glycoside hydrolase family 2 [Clostridia bacterium]